MTQYVTCTQCGARVSAEAQRCWLCGYGVLSDPEAPTDAVASLESQDPAEQSPSAVHAKQAHQFGIASLLITITLFAVFLGVFRLAPGLGIGLLLLVTPALIRGTVVATRAKAAGRPLNRREKFVAFLASMGLVTALLLSLGCTYLMSCGVGLIAYDIGLVDDDVAIIGSNAVGILAQLAFTILFIRWLWKRRGQQLNRLGDIGFIFSWVGFASIYLGAILAMTLPRFYVGDVVGWGLVASPGLILSLIAIRKPHRFLASWGVGLGLAGCVTTGVVFMVPGMTTAARPSTGTIVVLLWTLLAGIFVAGLVSLATYYGSRRLDRR